MRLSLNPELIFPYFIRKHFPLISVMRWSFLVPHTDGEAHNSPFLEQLSEAFKVKRSREKLPVERLYEFREGKNLNKTSALGL